MRGHLLKIRIKIPRIISPGPKPISTRCCIYHERAIVKDRVKIAITKDEDLTNIVNVIPSACDECSLYRYTVTEACRGCLNNNCKHSCKFNAISIVNGRAYINTNKSIESICEDINICMERNYEDIK